MYIQMHTIPTPESPQTTPHNRSAMSGHTLWKKHKQKVNENPVLRQVRAKTLAKFTVTLSSKSIRPISPLKGAFEALERSGRSPRSPRRGPRGTSSRPRGRQGAAAVDTDLEGYGARVPRSGCRKGCELAPRATDDEDGPRRVVRWSRRAPFLRQHTHSSSEIQSYADPAQASGWKMALARFNIRSRDPHSCDCSSLPCACTAVGLLCRSPTRPTRQHSLTADALCNAHVVACLVKRCRSDLR